MLTWLFKLAHTINQRLPKWLRNFSVGTKLLGAFMLIAIIIIALMTISYTVLIKDHLAKKITNDLHSVVESNIDYLDSIITYTSARTVDFASDGLIRNYTDRITANPDDIQYSQELNTHLIVNKQSLDRNITDIVIIDNDNIVLAATNANLINTNITIPSDEKVNVEQLQYGETIVSDVHTSTECDITCNQDHFIVYAPITNTQTNERIGTLLNVFSLSALTNPTTTNTTYSNDIHTLLVDDNEILITDFNKNDPLTTGTTIDTKPIHWCAIDKVYTGTYINHAGVEVIGSARCLDNNWIIISEIPTTTALALPNNILLWVFITSLTILVVIIMIALLSTAGVLVPLQQLEKIMYKVKEGDLSARVTIQSQDELGQLQKDFNTMIKKLELIDEEKSNFVSIASHQLNTPLGAMLWQLELLQNNDYGKLPKEAQRVTKEIHDNILRLIDLVNDLLNVSRIESGTTTENLRIVSVNDVIQKVCKELKPLFTKKNLHNELPLAKNLPEVHLSERHLYEVIKNIISNAIKYSTNGTITVTSSQTDSNVIVTVLDEGIGIPEKDKAKLFTKFFRGSKAMLSDTEGSGLGLFVVKSYVEDWDGTVSINNHPMLEHGTEVRFTIPLH